MRSQSIAVEIEAVPIQSPTRKTFRRTGCPGVPQPSRRTPRCGGTVSAAVGPGPLGGVERGAPPQRRRSGRGGQGRGEEARRLRQLGHRCCGGAGLSPAGGPARSAAQRHGPAAAGWPCGPRGAGARGWGRRPGADGGERPRADPSGRPGGGGGGGRGGAGGGGGRRSAVPGGAGRRQLQRGGLGAVRALQVSPQGRAGRREVAPGRARRSPRAWLCGARSGAAADTHGTVRPRLMQRRREGVGDAGNPPTGAAAGRGAACLCRGRGAGPGWPPLPSSPAAGAEQDVASPQREAPGCGTPDTSSSLPFTETALVLVGVVCHLPLLHPPLVFIA